MPDILFKCPNCAKSLAVDADVAGVEVECVDCRQKIVVPKPDFNFLCPSCKTVLSTARRHHGHDFTCTACNGKVTVPPPAAGKRPPPAPALPQPPQATGKTEAEDAGLGLLKPVDGDEYRRMTENMARRADALKPKRVPRWKKALLHVAFLAVFLGILHAVIGLFVETQVVRGIIFCVVAVVVLAGLAKFCLTSSLYD